MVEAKGKKPATTRYPKPGRLRGPWGVLAISGLGPDLDIANTPEGPRGLPGLGHLWESMTTLGGGGPGIRDSGKEYRVLGSFTTLG